MKMSASPPEIKAQTVMRPLGDLCRIVGGGTPSKKNPEFYQGTIPWVTVKEFTDFKITDTVDHITDEAVSFSATNVIPADTVLVVTRVGLGKVAMISRDMAINQDIKALFPGDQLLPEYLFWFLVLQSKEIERMGTGATVKGITLSQLRALSVPVPSHKKQRRIVDILHGADRIRRLRKQAQDTARQLIPALFIELFGDPSTNPKGWPIREVSDFVQRFEGGKNLKAGSDSPRNCRILKVSAVTSGIYRENESKPAPDDYSPPEKHYVRQGDLLFSRANTEALVGATALVDRTNNKTLLPDKLWRFVWAEEIEPIYVHALFQSHYVRQELSKMSTGTSASMRNISQAKLRTLKLPVPPNKEQKQFADRVRQIRSIMNQQKAAQASAESSFQSLLARAFSNEI